MRITKTQRLAEKVIDFLLQPSVLHITDEHGLEPTKSEDFFIQSGMDVRPERKRAQTRGKISFQLDIDVVSEF